MQLPRIKFPVLIQRPALGLGRCRRQRSSDGEGFHRNHTATLLPLPREGGVCRQRRCLDIPDGLTHIGFCWPRNVAWSTVFQIVSEVGSLLVPNPVPYWTVRPP